MLIALDARSKRGQRVAFVAVFALIFGTSMSSAESEDSIHELMVFDFSLESDVWRNVDDVVMGGVSSSRMRLGNDSAIFEGTLSLENNGGFASVRSAPIPADLAGYEGVRIRLKGDGKRYQFRIREEQSFDGPSLQISFETQEDVWSEIDLLFEDFTAAFRGRQLPNHPPLDSAKISTMGFLIADKQEGEFRLEIDWVKAYRSP